MEVIDVYTWIRRPNFWSPKGDKKEEDEASEGNTILIKSKKRESIGVKVDKNKKKGKKDWISAIT